MKAGESVCCVGLDQGSRMRRIARGVVVAGWMSAAVFALGQQMPRPVAQQKSEEKTYRIAGTVTNAVTGDAVAGATMTLRAGQPRETIQTVVTDANGHFELQPVEAGKYSLIGLRRGYITEAFDEHGQYSSAIVTGDDQDTEHIPFRLNPGAMIRGVVTEDGGEPVQDANVLLVLKSKTGGLGEHFVKSISGETDDTGLYEFWNLIPGTYFLAVSAKPWFATHRSLAERGEAESEEVRADEAALDVAYPVTYYDGATEESGATPIGIASGSRVQADVVLHAMPALHITVHSAESSGGEQKFKRMPALGQTVFGGQEFPTFAETQPGPPGSGVTEIAGIAPGHYSLSQTDPPQVVEMDATGNQAVDLSSGSPVYSVEIHARMADGSEPPQPLAFVLGLDEPGLRYFKENVMEKSTARFDTVPPGKWIVLPESKDLSLAVVRIEAGGQALAESQIVVKDRKVQVTAVLVEGKIKIEGFAKKDGKGEPGVMVELVPKDPGAGLALFRRDQSDSDGSFLFRDVVPGEYKIVAIEDAWDLDWARPEVISRYLAGGMALTVSGNAGDSVKLGSAVAVEAR